MHMGQTATRTVQDAVELMPVDGLSRVALVTNDEPT
jgi:hypothetical protein